MSNFHSNYNDIHKQIAIADFTDEQIQELMTALQTKRSAKSKLTKEEKVFYQCCRERRSYANNQDLDYKGRHAIYIGMDTPFTSERPRCLCRNGHSAHFGMATPFGRNLQNFLISLMRP